MVCFFLIVLLYSKKTFALVDEATHFIGAEFIRVISQLQFPGLLLDSFWEIAGLSLVSCMGLRKSLAISSVSL